MSIKHIKNKVFKAIIIIVFITAFTVFFSENILAKSKESHINMGTTQIKVGGKKQLKVSKIKEVISWKSNDINIASVSKTGIVTGKSHGKTIVIGSTKYKSYKFTIQVTSQYEFSFDESSVTLPNDITYIGLRVNFTKNGVPVDAPEDIEITSSNTSLFKINDYENRNSSIIINLWSDKTSDDEDISGSTKICINYEGKKAYCTLKIVPVSSMSLEDYAIVRNSKYIWNYVDSVYVNDFINSYDSLCSIDEREGTEGGEIFIRLSTGEEFYGKSALLASDGLGIFSDEFIPEGCEDADTDFISRNYDFRLFKFSDSIISSGTRNSEYETLEQIVKYVPLYVDTGKLDETGNRIFNTEPNHSSGTIIYMRTWVQVERDDAYFPPLLLKNFKLSDWGKGLYE